MYIDVCLASDSSSSLSASSSAPSLTFTTPSPTFESTIASPPPTLHHSANSVAAPQRVSSDPAIASSNSSLPTIASPHSVSNLSSSAEASSSSSSSSSSSPVPSSSSSQSPQISMEDNAWPISSPSSSRKESNNTSNNNNNNNLKNEVSNDNSQLRLGLGILASDSTGRKLEEFKQLGGRHFMPNLNITSWYNVLFRDVVEVDGWKIQQHKVTGYWRLLDANLVRHCWGSEAAFRVVFAALLKCDIEPTTNTKDIRLKITRIHPKTSAHTLYEIGEVVKTLEKGVVYPLGKDSFEIDHGANYFSFFQRLGELYYIAVFDEMPKVGTGLRNSGRGELAAVVACVKRQIPKNKKEKAMSVWYLCDLKVGRSYRRQHIPIWMGTSEAPSLYRVCSRGYAVIMDPTEGEAQTVKLSRFFKFVPIQIACKLAIFSLDASEMQKALPLLISHRGENISFLSLANVKDIILQSTNQPMNLLHVQFGPCADHTSPSSTKQVVNGAVHMFCSPLNDPLTKELREAGFKFSTTATVMHHRMSGFDWSFILTSDI